MSVLTCIDADRNEAYHKALAKILKLNQFNFLINNGRYKAMMALDSIFADPSQKCMRQDMPRAGLVFPDCLYGDRGSDKMVTDVSHPDRKVGAAAAPSFCFFVQCFVLFCFLNERQTSLCRWPASRTAWA